MSFIQKMKGQDYIDQTRKYLNYLEEHLENVKKAFDELSNACDGVMGWVGDDYSWHSFKIDVENHDISKFSDAEFCQYRQKFFPVEGEEVGDTFDCAWSHHQVKNHHHHETAQNYMDIVHMVIDWTAMGYKFGDTAKDYYEKNEQRIELKPEHEKFMFELFHRINIYRGTL